MHLISRRFWLLAVALVALGAYATTVWATPSTISLANSWKGTFSELDVKVPGQIKLKAKDATDVHVVRNAFDPGETTGWHSHPGPSLIIVTVGTITAYEPTKSGCVRREYTANTGRNTLIDPGDGHLHELRNETNGPAETVAVQFLPEGANRRIDEPTVPAQCA